ncbi:MAG TPA: hypothetical protein VN408_33355 [Actinoplanes sp.]|nr:hypothetical protein [Actinoplanes sp.]
MAGDEVRVEPVAVTRAADRMMRAAQSLSDAWRTAQGSLTVPDGAAGDSAGAGTVVAAAQDTTDGGGVAIGRLVAVLEGDMDRLYRIAFAYQKADDDAAEQFRRTHPNLPL